MQLSKVSMGVTEVVIIISSKTLTVGQIKKTNKTKLTKVWTSKFIGLRD